MRTSYDTLFDSIRTRCQREHWFGPELLNPNQYEGILDSDPRFDRRSVETIPVDDPDRLGFVFPTASEQLLATTEARLGFALPPLLRALYAHLANGGFGPGGGLKGVLEGYGKHGTGFYPRDDDTIVDQYHWRSEKGTVELTECSEWQVGEQRWSLPYGVWPARLLPLCDMGCMQEICIDSSEQVYVVAPQEDNDLYSLTRLPWNFETWLWRWIRDEDLLPR